MLVYTRPILVYVDAFRSYINTVDALGSGVGGVGYVNVISHVVSLEERGGGVSNWILS
jgi:hypothetical protein